MVYERMPHYNWIVFSSPNIYPTNSFQGPKKVIVETFKKGGLNLVKA